MFYFKSTKKYRDNKNNIYEQKEFVRIEAQLSATSYFFVVPFRLKKF